MGLGKCCHLWTSSTTPTTTCYGEGNGHPLPYSCLGNFTHRGGEEIQSVGLKESDTSEQLTHTTGNWVSWAVSYQSSKTLLGILKNFPYKGLNVIKAISRGRNYSHYFFLKAHEMMHRNHKLLETWK